MKFYGLLYDEEMIEMSIVTNPYISINKSKLTDGAVYQYSDYWYLSTDLNKIKRLSIAIRSKWIDELEKRIEAIDNMKVKRVFNKKKKEE